MKDTYFYPRQARQPQAMALAGMLMLGACASTPPPTTSLVMARAAIDSAEKAEAGRYAAPELSEARGRLAAAESAVKQENMASAQQLAQQSTVEANLANARAGEAKATAVNDDMKQSNAALGEELQRASGVTQ